LWNEIREATRELIESAGGELLDLLKRVEQSLDEEDMYDRVMARLKPSAHSAVEILDYRPAYKKHFKALNEAWLNEQFTPEGPDEAILSDPNGKIIRRGGAVLFARLGERIVGTCALIRHSAEIFELAKMAVAEKVRSRGIGLRIAEAVIERARALGAETLFLETSPKLVPAFHLYEKLGFRKVRHGPLGPTKYKRKTFAMTLELNGKHRSRKRK
jgi:N-acetylglutamate synthase-like GNAT family acetyltransferase